LAHHTLLGTPHIGADFEASVVDSAFVLTAPPGDHSA
jgi:hypothetical protein